MLELKSAIWGTFGGITLTHVDATKTNILFLNKIFLNFLSFFTVSFYYSIFSEYNFQTMILTLLTLEILNSEAKKRYLV